MDNIITQSAREQTKPIWHAVSKDEQTQVLDAWLPPEQFAEFEKNVFIIAELLIPDYRHNKKLHASWEHVKLGQDNEHIILLKPTWAKKITLCNPNMYVVEGSVSAELATLAINLFALKALVRLCDKNRLLDGDTYLMCLKKLEAYIARQSSSKRVNAIVGVCMRWLAPL